MKIQQLECVIAIAREGSVTKAARSLFQAQPNVSTALRELETEIGIQIFWRTPAGMILTPEGEDFLTRAKSIIEDLHSLEKDYISSSGSEVVFSASTTRSSYITSAIGEWITGLQKKESGFKVHVHETNSHKVIEDTVSGKSDIGFIRIESDHKELYLKQLTDRKLKAETLIEYPIRLLFKRDHPLAVYDDVPAELLKNYTEIVHGDDDLAVLRQNMLSPDFESFASGRKVYIYDRGSQMSMLNTVKDSYMWVSPIPKAMYTSAGLTMRSCSYARMLNMDLMICRRSSENHSLIKSCAAYIRNYAAKILADEK